MESQDLPINENHEPKQIIEGVIEGPVEEWEKNPPCGIDPKAVTFYIDNRNRWCWRLKPEHIMDPEERKRCEEEEDLWRADLT